MEEEITLTDLEKDKLKETANIGAGHASSALSEIINQRVNLVVSDINFVSAGSLGELVKGPQQLVVGIYTPLVNSMSGSILIMFNIDSAMKLVSTVNGGAQEGQKVLTKDDQELLKKIGNVVSDSYVKSLNQFLGLELAYEKTNLVTTFGETIMDIITLCMDEDAKTALLVNTDFMVESKSIEGKFILLLAVKAIDTVFNALKSQV